MERWGVIPCHKQIYFFYTKSHSVMENIKVVLKKNREPIKGSGDAFRSRRVLVRPKRVTTNFCYYYYYYCYYCCCCCCCCLSLLLLESNIFFCPPKKYFTSQNLRCKDPKKRVPKNGLTQIGRFFGLPTLQGAKHADSRSFVGSL